ncbi:MAG: Gfo/Idh/MocA family oxidoreductase [candidate division WOR-3 bacterium]
METRVRIGVVGCGTQAQLVHLPLLRASSLAEVYALCDPDTRKLNHLASRYGAKRHYVDFDDLKQDPDVQAVVIATPNYLHSPIACMEYGKDVLCESPLGLSAFEAREMLAVAKREGRLLMPCLNYRLRPDVAIIRRFIEGGDLGTIYYTKAGWLRGRGAWRLSGWHADRLRAGGGAFMSLGSEILDFSLYLLRPAEPISVVGAAHRKEGGASSIHSEGPGVEDSAFALVRFDRDLILTIEVGWSLLREEDMTFFNVFGSKGAALLNPIQINKEMHGHLVNVTPALTSRDPLRSSAQRQLEAFLRAILYQEDPPVKAEDGIRVNELIDTFYQSVATHKEAYLPSPEPNGQP